MKALQMTFISEATRAIKKPVKDMTQLRGGVGDKKLDHHQIRRLIEEKKARQRQFQEVATQRSIASRTKKESA